MLAVISCEEEGIFNHEAVQKYNNPVAMFFSLYAIVHILLKDNLNTYSVYKDIVTSLLAGFALGLINICIIARGKSWHFGYECLVFWITFAVVQVISAILFYGYYLSGISQNSIWYKLLYYFPQMVVVLFTIPGAILYHFVGYIATRYLQARRNAYMPNPGRSAD